MQNHLQNTSLHDLPVLLLLTLGRVDGYLYYSPLTSSHKIRVPTLIAVSHLTSNILWGTINIETCLMFKLSIKGYLNPERFSIHFGFQSKKYISFCKG